MSNKNKFFSLRPSKIDKAMKSSTENIDYGIYFILCLCIPAICRIPDDCIDNKRYPLFIAREVMQALLEQLQP